MSGERENGEREGGGGTGEMEDAGVRECPQDLRDELVERVARLWSLRAALYRDEPCGGPLHIMLDDGNMRDDDLAFSWRAARSYPTVTRLVSEVILRELLMMSPGQRLYWYEGRDLREIASVWDRDVELGDFDEHVREPFYSLCGSWRLVPGYCL